MTQTPKPPTTQSVIGALRRAGLYSSSVYMSVYKSGSQIMVGLVSGYNVVTRANIPRTETATEIVECLRAKGWSVQSTLRDCSYTISVMREVQP